MHSVSASAQRAPKAPEADTDKLSPLGEARIGSILDDTRVVTEHLPSQETTNLFKRITNYFHLQGYRTPETLTIIDSRAPNAFVRRSREVVLTTTLVKQVTDPSEMAFVIAHEAAHVALGHHVQRGISAEVAADTLALNIVTALGYNPCSGRSVLERLGSPAQLTLVSLTPRLHSLHDQTSSLCG
ncbi:MAG: Peptidase family [Pseudomonadota bacterium]|jgi:Zn-dependent protease with chaperone function